MASNQNPSSNFSSSQLPSVGQAQMMRSESEEQSNTQNQQDTNFISETGTQVKNMATAAGGAAVNVARGAAVGAANLATGAADVVKNTLGINPNDNSNTPNDANRAASNLNNPSNTHPSNI